MLSLKFLFPEVVKVLEYVKKEGDNPLSPRQASGILIYFDTFDFVFYLHLMLHILGLTNVLSRALQRKDQNILEAVSLVQGTKSTLQNFRLNGFDELLKDVCSFCQKYGLEMLNMDEAYVVSRNRKRNITNHHYFKFDVFSTVLDMIIHEFGDRFSEVSTELLTNMAALSPRNSFSMHDASKLMKLSEMYPMDSNQAERNHLKRELDIYYEVVR
ncbi:uncharacterized protein [Rutidosis leptorrhynchoides]|uniref:uncharacterized protein n=1 Tax=Rutidosis leptorrhynchoides TaxID=125765 RepID=UPI003A98DDBE